MNRAEASLRALGVRRLRKGPGPRPAAGWDSLTDAEFRVVRLVAEGLTNRQIGERLFVSRHSRDACRTRFGKLGLSTRVELAAEVARRSS